MLWKLHLYGALAAVCTMIHTLRNFINSINTTQWKVCYYIIIIIENDTVSEQLETTSGQVSHTLLSR